MANTLRIKRRLTGATGAPSSLANAELAFNEVDGTLYYGKGDASGTATSVIAIGAELGTGVAAFLKSPTSANLATAITNETGTAGSLVFSASPSFTGALQHNYSSATIGEGYAFFNLSTVDTNTSTTTNVFSVDDNGTVTIGGGSPTLNSTTVRATNYLFNSATTFTAGTNAQGQGVLSAEVTVVTTTAANPSGVTLPTATSGRGRRVTVINKGTNAINVYPTTGGTIDGGAANAAYNIPVNSQVTFFGTGAGIWYSLGANTILSSAVLGTPSSGTLTNCTGLPISTGVSGLGTGVATFLGTPSSANLASAVTDETGSGSLVFATSPTLVTPVLGTPSSGTLTSCTGLPISTGVSGLGTGVATFLATPSSSNLASAVTDETGSGSLVFATSPVLTTPNIGTPSAGTLTSCTGLPISTGVSGLGTGVATFLATPSSANLISAVTDETGSGSLVFGTNPSLSGINYSLASNIQPTGSTLAAAASLTADINYVNGSTVGGDGVKLPAASNGRRMLISNSCGITIKIYPSLSSGFINGLAAGSPFVLTDGAVVEFIGVSNVANVWQALSATSSLSGLGTNVATFLATPSSSNLASAVTDETGSGSLVFATSPTLVTPNIGVATGTSFNSITGLSSTTPVVNGTAAVGTGTTAARADHVHPTDTSRAATASTLAQFAATTSSQLAGVISDETGSGVLVFGTSPTITTSIVAGSVSMDIFNTTATTVNAFGAATTLSVGAGTGNTTINNNLTVTGNLTINGTTTTVNSTTVTIDDPIFTIGGDTAPGSNDSKDRGIEFRWHNGTAAKVGFFGYDASASAFTFVPDATNSSEVFSGTAGDVLFGKVNKVTITAPASSATLTIADGKTLTASNTLTFAGTDSTTMTFPSTSATVAGLGIANAFTGANTFTNATGQTYRPAATQDGIVILGRAGGTSSYAVSLSTATLSANRTISFPDAAGTVVTTSTICTDVGSCTLDGGTF
jgi:hypothetical protein